MQCAACGEIRPRNGLMGLGAWPYAAGVTAVINGSLGDSASMVFIAAHWVYVCGTQCASPNMRAWLISQSGSGRRVGEAQ